MEPQQHHHQTQQQPNEDNNGSARGGLICRQSSTRWTPTTDQIRILKDLYYNNGVRSPSAEQIQRISARLRQYGKIEGKNVFYWFQNHKARERQKKRFTNDVPMQQRTVSNSANWKPEDYSIHNKYSNIKSGFSSASPSSAAVLSSVGQMGNYGYGSVTMEKSFRDCSIAGTGANNGVGGSISQHYGSWVGIDPYTSSYTLFEKRKSTNETPEDEEQAEEEEEEEEEEDQEEEAAPELETLPLFPMHREDHINAICSIKHNSNFYCRNWYGSDDGNGSSRASLELSLNSYTGHAPDSI